LDHCEIPPIRTEFVEELGQGAFGKVNKVKLKDGLEYFNKFNQKWVNTTRKQKIVAVKELHGEWTATKVQHCLACRRRKGRESNDW